MGRQLTIRGVPEEVGRRLEQLSRERSKSLNATVVDILQQAVGHSERRRRLERYATWTDEDVAEIDAAVAGQRTIDETLWR